MKHSQRGFTIIELLLVIALIAAMSVSGIALFQQRTTQLKIEKTALQIQQWLQAAMSYYVDNGAWPTDVSQLLQDANNSTKAYYLPLSVANNPWGYAYSIQPIQNNRLIEVTVNVPVFNAGNLLAYAQRIAARLPNATATGTATTALVSADANVPGSAIHTNNGNSISIIGIYKITVPVKQGYEVPKPTEQQCPSASNVANVYYSLSAIQNLNVDPTKGWMLSNIENAIDIDPKSTYYNNYHNGNLWKPDLFVQMYQGVSKTAPIPRNAGILIAIVTCEPKAAKLAARKAINGNESDGQKFIF